MEQKVIGKYPEIQIIDRSAFTEPHAVLLSFALEEWWCRHMKPNDPPIVHFWRHPRAFVMGLRDSRLQHVRKAKAWIEAIGYTTAVRNSGGAAVPLDEGVLNVSWLSPKPIHQVEIQDQFMHMSQWIELVIKHFEGTIERGERLGAYCPGAYDLSIAGRKFCGIAQRRLQQATSVQAFLNVEGSGQERAQIVEQFYAKARGDEEETIQISPQVTASISELMNQSISVQEVIQQFKLVLRESGANLCLLEDPTKWMPPQDELQAYLTQMHTRYGIR